MNSLAAAFNFFSLIHVWCFNDGKRRQAFIQKDGYPDHKSRSTWSPFVLNFLPRFSRTLFWLVLWSRYPRQKIDHRNMTQDELINTVNLLEGRSAGQSAGDGTSDYIHIDNYEKFRKKRYIRKSTPKSHHSSHQQKDRSRSHDRHDGHRRSKTDNRSGYSRHISQTSHHNYFWKLKRWIWMKINVGD